MNTLKMLWAVHPLEVIAGGALAVFCGLVFAVCMACAPAWAEVDEFYDDAD